MYLIEGGKAGFDSIPRSIYWAIVTLTTVGYGDILPQSSLGQTFASFIMILGYSIIAVPTGIVTAEITFAAKNPKKQRCIVCGKEGLANDAKFSLQNLGKSDEEIIKEFEQKIQEEANQNTTNPI